MAPFASRPEDSGLRVSIYLAFVAVSSRRRVSSSPENATDLGPPLGRFVARRTVYSVWIAFDARLRGSRARFLESVSWIVRLRRYGWWWSSFVRSFVRLVSRYDGAISSAILSSVGCFASLLDVTRATVANHSRQSFRGSNALRVSPFDGFRGFRSRRFREMVAGAFGSFARSSPLDRLVELFDDAVPSIVTFEVVLARDRRARRRRLAASSASDVVRSTRVFATFAALGVSSLISTRCSRGFVTRSSSVVGDLVFLDSFASSPPMSTLFVVAAYLARIFSLLLRRRLRFLPGGWFVAPARGISSFLVRFNDSFVTAFVSRRVSFRSR